jgi:hypothetical protein
MPDAMANRTQVSCAAVRRMLVRVAIARTGELTREREEVTMCSSRTSIRFPTLISAVLVIACTASASPGAIQSPPSPRADAKTAGDASAQDVASLIRLLKDPTAKSLDAKFKLQSCPAELVVPAILELLNSDPNIRKDGRLRCDAYEVLAMAHVTRDGKLVLADAGQLEQLRIGLNDESERVRQQVARGLAMVGAQRAPDVVRWLLPHLHDESLLVVVDAASSLGRIGAPAEPALPTLLALLENPDANAKLRWDEARRRYADLPDTDIEIDVRAACADARIRIAGIGVDLDRYGQLDARGQSAAIQALKGHAFQQILCAKTDAELPALDIQSRMIDLCARYLESTRGTKSEARQAALGPPMWIAARNGATNEVGIRARSVVERAATDPDETLALLAKIALPELDRRRK